MTSTQKNLLFVLRQAPYGSSLAREAIDAVLAAAVFDQPVAVLFTADAVWQLIDGEAGAIERKSCAKAIASFPLYDIERLYIDSDALAARRLEATDLVVRCEPVDAAGIRQLLAQADAVLSF